VCELGGARIRNERDGLNVCTHKQSTLRADLPRVARANKQVFQLSRKTRSCTTNRTEMNDIRGGEENIAATRRENKREKG